MRDFGSRVDFSPCSQGGKGLGGRAGHGDDEQGPRFRPIRNNRTGRIDKALVAEGRHRGAVRHVEKTRGLPPPEPARPRTPGAGADRTHARGSDSVVLDSWDCVFFGASGNGACGTSVS